MQNHSRNKAIHDIYHKFNMEWTEDNYPELFKEMERMYQDHPEKYLHELGHFAIFYTPIPEGDIDCMVIGNYPSWFDSDPEKALAIILDLKKGPPEENLYLEGDFKFAGEMKKVFADHQCVLSNIVGLNRFWVQLGTEPEKFKKTCVIRRPKKLKKL